MPTNSEKLIFSIFYWFLFLIQPLKSMSGSLGDTSFLSMSLSTSSNMSKLDLGLKVSKLSVLANGSWILLKLTNKWLEFKDNEQTPSLALLQLLVYYKASDTCRGNFFLFHLQKRLHLPLNSLFIESYRIYLCKAQGYEEGYKLCLSCDLTSLFTFLCRKRTWLDILQGQALFKRVKYT